MRTVSSPFPLLSPGTLVVREGEAFQVVSAHRGHLTVRSNGWSTITDRAESFTPVGGVDLVLAVALAADLAELPPPADERRTIPMPRGAA
jgi:hypothetical protein